MSLAGPVQSRRRLTIGIMLVLISMVFLALFWHQQIRVAVGKLMVSEMRIHSEMLSYDPEYSSLSIKSKLEHLERYIDQPQKEIVVLKDQDLASIRLKGVPFWANYQYKRGQIDYQRIIDRARTENSSDPIFWFDRQKVFASSSFTYKDQSYWIIEAMPSASFRSHWSAYWLTFFSAIVLISILSYLSAKLLLIRTTGPVNSLREGIEKLQNGDFTYEYIDQSIPEVDQLGQSLTRVIKQLQADRSSLISGQQQYSLLLEKLNLGVLVIDSQGKVDLMNPALTEIMGLGPTAIGRPYQAVIKSFQLINLINTVVHTKDPIQDEVEVFVPNSKFLDVNIFTYQDIAGSECSYLVLLYDISEIRRLETVRSEFVANASHELRTPVTAIKGFAETLLAGALKDIKMSQKFVNIIAKESNRLEVIIEDILELSRVEKKDNSHQKTSFDLVTVTYSMLEFLSQKINNKQIKTFVEAPESAMIAGNQHRVEQILTNLVDNAINYSEKGSQITVTIKLKKKWVELSVSDTGIGIPEQELERIFERFYRVDKARSRYSGGTGLGLSIVRNLVKMIDGKIDVTSQVGVGTTFTVTLPY